MPTREQTINVEVRLPREIAEELAAVAKLARVKPETLIRIAVAYEIRREQRRADQERKG